ncbi:MAG: hypothetical protein OEW45_12180 [Deltaproteobacteria bacterium]|nr:hypothetical protein [Deltaproteobacteria bacterium]
MPIPMMINKVKKYWFSSFFHQGSASWRGLREREISLEEEISSLGAGVMPFFGE